MYFEEEVEKPSNFDEMKILAKKLADNLPFARVDFYSAQGKTYFGEITIYPGDGKEEFTPFEYNRSIGDYLKLPEIPKQQQINTVF